jgi:hypothetical protein
MHRLVSAGILATLILAALPAQGTVMIYLNEKELTERSQVVVQGTVQQQQVIPLQGHLWTDTHVRVTASLKGYLKPGQMLVLRQPGGETATLGTKVAGAATFKLKQQVVVFARPVGSAFVPVGMALGAFHVSRDCHGIERVSRDLRGLAMANFDARGKMSINHIGTTGRTLKGLITEIKTYSAGSKGGAR